MAQEIKQWEIHDMHWPQPAVVQPAPQNLPIPAPQDAILLFNGNGLSHWQKVGGGSAGWRIEEDYLEVVKGAGSIATRQVFGDCQLHLEWATPAKIEGDGQGRGNSGVFLMSQYEVQVLDCYQNQTYPDGQAAAIYGQYPPLVNASLAPGEWQCYDIFFRRPRFDSNGKLLEPARITVLHNGVLVQNNVALTGPTGHHQRPHYSHHPDKLPLELQDHGNPVRFRNIWIRDLNEQKIPFPPLISPGTTIFEKPQPITVTMAVPSAQGEIRFTIDGSEPNHGSQLYTGPFQARLNSVIKAQTIIDGVGASPTAVASYSLVKPGVNGLRYEYFEGQWEKLPDFATLPTVKRGTSYSFDIQNIANRSDYYGIVFTGHIRIENPGEYTFFTRSDDGSQLFIDARQVVENDGLHGVQEAEGKIWLKEGKHPITVRYFQESGDRVLEVFYQGPGLSRQSISPHLFFLAR